MEINNELQTKKEIATAFERELIESKTLIKEQELKLQISSSNQAQIELAHRDLSRDNAFLNVRILALETQLQDKTAEALAIQLRESRKELKDANDLLVNVKFELSEVFFILLN